MATDHTKAPYETELHQGRLDGTPGMVEVPAECIKPYPRQQPVAPGEMVELEGGEPRPDAVRGTHPSGIGAAYTGMLVEIGKCLGCGAWWPKEVKDESTQCPRCIFATGLPVLTEPVKQAMQELRWRLDVYRRYRERDRQKEHDAFVKVTDAAWRCGPILLLFLEKLYGDQQIKGLVEMATGDLWASPAVD